MADPDLQIRVGRVVILRASVWSKHMGRVGGGGGGGRGSTTEYLVLSKSETFFTLALMQVSL